MITKIMFTVTFPADIRPIHVHPLKLHSLAKHQLPDVEVIDTIEHLFGCQHCFEQYRFIRTSYHASL
ncbi:MAG: hypothetical protein VYC91_03925 [Acidobacteriota bacterium]|nr:hypothetical protein [Acidobacteriota bacterium]